MTEDQLELEAINWLVDTGYTHACGYAYIAANHSYKLR